MSWPNWNFTSKLRDLPPVNYAENSSEEEEENQEADFESGLTFDSPLQSPTRPPQSPSVSPRALLQPDQPIDSELADQLNKRLEDIHQDLEEEEVSGEVIGKPDTSEVNAPNNPDTEDQVVNQPIMAEAFDIQNDTDGDKAQEHARGIRVEFDTNDVKFWFSQLEGELLMATVKSQWLKKTVLQRNLPTKQKEDVKALLVLEKEEAGNDIYKRIKSELLRIYSPKPSDSYRKALTRQMVGLPSQLGHQIVDDICKKAAKLTGCCCAAAAQALWSIQLPVHVRQHISNMEFTAQTYKEVFQAADQCYMSSKQVSIAAVAAPLDETLPAFDQQNQPVQVAAVQRGRGRGGRGNRGNRGSGRGGRNQGQATTSRPKRHPSNPSELCCDRHYQFADQAWYCTKPLTCPMVNKVAEKK